MLQIALLKTCTLIQRALLSDPILEFEWSHIIHKGKGYINIEPNLHRFDTFLMHFNICMLIEILLTDLIYSVLKRLACLQIDNRDNLFVMQAFYDHQGS